MNVTLCYIVKVRYEEVELREDIAILLVGRTKQTYYGLSLREIRVCKGNHPHLESNKQFC